MKEDEWAPSREIDAGKLFCPNPQSNPEVVNTSEDTVNQYAATMGGNISAPTKEGYLKANDIDMPDDAYTRLFNKMPESWKQAELEKIFGKG